MKQNASYTSRTMLFSIVILLLAPVSSSAQQYPTRPVSLLVAAGPGGTGDLTLRPLASKAEKFLGQPIAVSNNGAGGGSVALGQAAREKPDGYHLLGTVAMHLVVFPQVRQVPYDPDDFVPIVHYGAPVAGIAARTDAPFKSLKELVEYAKKNPGKVSYSVGGVDSPNHLVMEYIARKEGIQWTMIPFQGGAPALTALMGAHVNVTSGMVTSWIPHAKEGSLRILTTLGRKRSEILPDVPTLSESGYGIVYEDQCLVVAPKGVPSAIVRKLEEAFRKGTEDVEFVKVMAKMGMEVDYGNSEDAKNYLKQTHGVFGNMIQEVRGTKR